MYKILSKNTVHLKDRTAVEFVISKMVNSGADHLQVITDFDYTISKSRTSRNTMNPTSHGILDMVPNGVDPELKKQLRALREFYYPIEMDPQLSNEEKIPHMEKWWLQAHELISKAGFNRAMLEVYVEEANLELRDGWQEFLRVTENSGIPVVIFSAGIGNLIEMVLQKQCGNVPANVHIISNMMQFDDAGNVIGFNAPLIHTFNKNRSVVQKERAFFSHLADRPNVLMLGDTLGDLNMDVGVVNEGLILKIGFLNQMIEASLPKYLEGYAVVLADDQTFDVPLEVLKAITAQNTPR